MTTWKSLFGANLAAVTLATAFCAATPRTSPLPPPAANAQLTRADLTTWLDGFVPFAIARADVAGAVVVIVKNGEVLVQKGYGYADVAAKRPVDPATTLFRAGSVSKLFTWTAAMQLVERGKLDLDRDINAYLDFTIPPFQGQPVTLRNLMTHTAGFNETDKCVVAPNPGRAVPLEKVAKDCLPERVYPPGVIPAYSNYGATLTGYLVQRVSGEPFDDYMERHIFAPLGMTHASFRQPLPNSLQPLMSRGYQRGSGPPQPYEFTGVAPAGSLALTGSDMSHFMIAHLQDGRLGDSRILGDAAARQMHDTPLTLVNPAVSRMMLGFYEAGHNGHRGIGHAGDTLLFHSALWLLPEDNIGIFISLNSTGNPVSATGLRKALFEGFIERYLPPPPAPSAAAVPNTISQQHAALLAGTYEDSHRWVGNFMSLLTLLEPIVVRPASDGQLTVSSLTTPAGKPRLFKEVEPFLWRDVAGEQFLAARLTNDKVVMLDTGPTEALLPSPSWRNASWWFPLLELSLAANVFSILLWAITATARKRLGIPAPPPSRTLSSYRLARAASGLSALLLGAWLFTLYTMLATFSLTSAMDPWITVLHVLSLIIFPAAVAAATWHVWTGWRSGTGWRGSLVRGWSVVLLGSNFVCLWVASAYHLIGFGLDY